MTDDKLRIRKRWAIETALCASWAGMLIYIWSSQDRGQAVIALIVALALTGRWVDFRFGKWPDGFRSLANKETEK